VPTPAPRLSEDGTTAVLITALRPPDGASGEAIADATAELRGRLGGIASPGLQVAVTGAAGFEADSVAVFEGINGTLLGGAALLVFVPAGGHLPLADLLGDPVRHGHPHRGWPPAAAATCSPRRGRRSTARRRASPPC
jgi:hypothetical protein